MLTLTIILASLPHWTGLATDFTPLTHEATYSYFKLTRVLNLFMF
ncbi:hypothetical protein Xmau_02176 [Xenorhabdus mauleonii]|uniref:Uncharacterized protein n=1 Tax=Xenorhabdus mauleonii TaxID=351675 RepID=A0A1I3QD53_9GAMM|nr:hypothetical protein Xmau_02176 [Xenorhabdus mauleonii]SFJ32194.1 hypothetical protein SAMN05421680_107132 [Xenorhabdus mauleonii]